MASAPTSAYLFHVPRNRGVAHRGDRAYGLSVRIEISCHTISRSFKQAFDSVKPEHVQETMARVGDTIALLMGPVAPVSPPPQPKQHVWIKGGPDLNKIAAIKILRGLTGLGLKDSKDLVEASIAGLKPVLCVDDAAQAIRAFSAEGVEVFAQQGVDSRD